MRLREWVIIAGVLILTTGAFLFGSYQDRVAALLVSLCLGLVHPHYLFFGLAVSYSLEVSDTGLTPTRLFIIFSSVRLLLRPSVTRQAFANSNWSYLILVASLGGWGMLAEFVHLLGSSEGIAQWMYLLVIFVFVVNAALGHVENIDKALKYFCLGLIPVAILCGAYVFELRSPLPGEELVTDEGLRFRGPVADPNYLASVLVCGLGICLGSLRLSRRLQSMIIYSVGAGLFLSAIWATQSRGGLYTSGALMALTATQALMAQRRKSSKIVILISLLLLTGSTLVALNSPSRFNAILETRGIELGRSVSNAAINEILEHPLFGIGDALYLTKHGLAPHNTYLSFAVAAGFLGLGIALTIFSLCAIWTLRSSKLWAEAAFMCLMGSLIILGSFSALGHKPLWFAATVASFAMKKERENGFPP